jgi:3D (Asp-Asp-Asp) domain-containing protein
MPSRGTPSSAGPWINFIATFYNNDEASTGKRPGHPAYGITASGRQTTQGVTIAVDPRVIPLGSIVEIEYPDGRREYRRADDTGSAIKGYKIDIFSNQPDSALYALGKQNIKLRILKKGA